MTEPMASPEFDLVVEMLRSRPRGDEPSVEALRAGLEQLAATTPMPDGTSCTSVVAGAVPCEWVVARGASRDTVVLYLHGGSYVLGSIATHRNLAARLSAASGASALVVGYRLAPEHPFPAALHDALAAYRWLRTRVDPARIVVAGDSAGGGLAAATLVALRDAGDALPAGAALLSPWVDLEGTGGSLAANAGADPMIDRDGLLRAAAAYLGGADPRTPLAAPLHADLAGLPPLFIQVGGREALLDDALRFAARARAAGVPVRLDRWDEMVHVWQAFAPLVPEATAALARAGVFIRTRVRSRRGPLRSARATGGRAAGAACPGHAMAALSAAAPEAPRRRMRATPARPR